MNLKRSSVRTCISYHSSIVYGYPLPVDVAADRIDRLAVLDDVVVLGAKPLTVALNGRWGIAEIYFRAAALATAGTDHELAVMAHDGILFLTNQWLASE